jgi:NADH-quinone oxidoreductase subunit G
MAAVDAVISASSSASVLPALRRGNVRGALSVGLAPQGGADAAAILEAAASGRVECLVLLGADPLNDVPDADLARRGIAGAKFIVSLDTFMSPSTAHADVVLPVAAYGEKDGTTMNLEGRVTNVVQKITARGTSRADWMIAAELADMLGHDLGVTTVADVQKRMAATIIGFGATTTSVAIKRDGVIVSVASPVRTPLVSAPAAARSSYDFRVVMGRKLYDKAIGTATSPAMSALAPGARVTVHPLDLERVGAAEGANVRVSNSHSSVVLPVFASESVARGTAVIPFNQPGADIRELVRHSESVVDVRIESIS